MSKPLEAATSEIVVHVVRPGAPVKDYPLSQGATLADLLNLIGSSTTDPRIYVQGVPIEEAVPLNDGMVVTIVPESRNGVVDQPWRQVSKAFQENPLLEEYLEIMREQRRREYPEEELGA